MGQKTCTRPFVFLELQENRVFNCCPSWIDDHYIGTYTSGKSIFEIWNSLRSQAIRESMFDGSFSFCNRKICPVLHQEQLQDLDDILAGKHGEKLREIFSNQKTEVSPPDTINLCYDQSCNLRCPSCRTDLITVNQEHPKYELKRQLQEQVLEFIHSSKQPVRLSLTGSGDPFASRLFYEFLGRINLTQNPNISLTLQTNGVMFDASHWERISNVHGCKNIDVYISLDAGSEETYKKVRRGGNWIKLMNNLDYIAGLRDQGVLSYVRLDMVVQDNNYREINDFIGIAQKHAFYCMLMRITNWGTFSKEEFMVKNIFLNLTTSIRIFGT